MKYLILLLAVTSISAFAEPRFNPYESEWENAGADEELKYNPMNDEWSYEEPDSELEYSPLYDEGDQWQYGEGEEDE